ncbi:hypothetical protein [Kitasatospora viridis]|uniref:Uncharacterized protein n=1 Tax=Kitasatospora viridis TaxID=281105 RepID=A0A561SDT3_9ACTN|nr:hypothetical protein [Kitasatospora viridis]TWF73032.1 hypothetical protein FHX73_16183 [Kitasatospora viridis]
MEEESRCETGAGAPRRGAGGDAVRAIRTLPRTIPRGLACLVAALASWPAPRGGRAGDGPSG